MQSYPGGPALHARCTHINITQHNTGNLNPPDATLHCVLPHASMHAHRVCTTESFDIKDANSKELTANESAETSIADTIASAKSSKKASNDSTTTAQKHIVKITSLPAKRSALNTRELSAPTSVSFATMPKKSKRNPGILHLESKDTLVSITSLVALSKSNSGIDKKTSKTSEYSRSHSMSSTSSNIDKRLASKLKTLPQREKEACTEEDAERETEKDQKMSKEELIFQRDPQ